MSDYSLYFAVCRNHPAKRTVSNPPGIPYLQAFLTNLLNLSGATFLSACLRNLVTVVRFRILHNLPTRNRAAETRLRASLARFFALTRSPLTAREAEAVRASVAARAHAPSIAGSSVTAAMGASGAGGGTGQNDAAPPPRSRGGTMSSTVAGSEHSASGSVAGGATTPARDDGSGADRALPHAPASTVHSTSRGVQGASHSQVRDVDLELAGGPAGTGQLAGRRGRDANDNRGPLVASGEPSPHAGSAEIAQSRVSEASPTYYGDVGGSMAHTAHGDDTGARLNHRQGGLQHAWGSRVEPRAEELRRPVSSHSSSSGHGRNSASGDTGRARTGAGVRARDSRRVVPSTRK